MKRELTVANIGPDLFEVKSKKKEKEDVYIVDVDTQICDCKGWYYSADPKTCIHLKHVIALLKDGGDCIDWKDKNRGLDMSVKREVSEDVEILFNGGQDEM